MDKLSVLAEETGIFNNLNILLCDTTSKSNNSDSFMSFLLHSKNYQNYVQKQIGNYKGYLNKKIPVFYLFSIIESDITELLTLCFSVPQGNKNKFNVLLLKTDSMVPCKKHLTN